MHYSLLSSRRHFFIALGGLMLLFCMRVLGQLLVALFNVPFLPPMQQWYSGLLPYHVLLPCQFVIITLQAKICMGIAGKRNRWSVPNPKLGRCLRIIGIIYAAGMLLRYMIQMYMHPETRWFGGSIPIFFHFVLAAFLLVLAKFHGSQLGSKELGVQHANVE